MATLNQFKQEIAKLAVAQKAAKSVNNQGSVYMNRGMLHAMYIAYYVLKHKLIGDAERAYYDQVKDSWKDLQLHGWCGYSGGSYNCTTWSMFMNRVSDLIDKYSE